MTLLNSLPEDFKSKHEAKVGLAKTLAKDIDFNRAVGGNVSGALVGHYISLVEFFTPKEVDDANPLERFRD